MVWWPRSTVRIAKEPSGLLSGGVWEASDDVSRAVVPGGSVALSGIAVWLAAVFAALASGGRLLCFGAALGGCTAFGTGA